MAVESATRIHQLNASSPSGSDPISEGAAQLRVIKAAVKGSFPAFGVETDSGIVTLGADVINAIPSSFEPVITSLPVSKGGTGITSYTTGNFVRAASSSALQQRTPAQVRADIGADNASNLASGTVADARLPTSQSVKQFATIELGHASDTTLSRAAAGKLSVEGKAVIKHAGSFTSGEVTVSTSAPSGGSNGDIWLRV